MNKDMLKCISRCANFPGPNNPKVPLTAKPNNGQNKPPMPIWPAEKKERQTDRQTDRKDKTGQDRTGSSGDVVEGANLWLLASGCRRVPSLVMEPSK